MILKIVSYNIWFDSFMRQQRITSLLSKIFVENPEVICLQEVIEETHSRLSKELKTVYKYTYPEFLPHRYGCVIYSKHPIEKATSLKFKSNMGRQLDLAYIRLPTGNSIVIGNTHFESEFEEHNNVKKLQYRYASAMLQKIHNDNISDINYVGTLLCSDTNLTKYDENYYSTLFSKFKDVWSVNDSDGYTYDTKTNSLLTTINIENEIRARIDRILYLPKNMKQVSSNTLKGDILEISDHYGIFATFVI